METSSGNSSGTAQNHSYGAEGGLMDQKKRKRMECNRESARRSRMRKQKQLDDLMGQVIQLKEDNNQILTNINNTSQHLVIVEAENSILRAQMSELSQRLQSLNEIMNTSNEMVDNQAVQLSAADNLMNPLNMMYLYQPMMAAADMFQY